MRKTQKKHVVPAKKEDIVRAATLLFSRLGFRKTSVDLIAAEAQVAKPTVYAYFDDKNALFAAVCRDVVDRVLEGAAQARDAGKDVTERITGMLSAKFTRVFELLDSSPYARELLEARNEEARRAIDEGDVRYFEMMLDEVRSAAKRGDLDLERAGFKPPALARLLMQAAHGAGYGATSPGEQKANLTKLIALLLSGAGPRPSR